MKTTTTGLSLSNVWQEVVVQHGRVPSFSSSACSAGYVDNTACGDVQVTKEIYFIFIVTTPCWENYNATPENNGNTTTVQSLTNELELNSHELSLSFDIRDVLFL